MNAQEITNYLGYLDVFVLLLGVVFIGGAIVMPNLNSLAEELLGNHLGNLAIVFVIAFVLILLSIFTGQTNLLGLNISPADFLLEALISIFFFSLFIVISMGISGVATGKLNWLLITGLTFVLNYVFNHYVKTLI